MATVTTTKPQTKAEPKTTAVAPHGAFPDFLESMRTEFDQLFDRFSRGWPTLWKNNGKNWRWDLQVHNEDDALVVQAEAPGFEPGDFDIQIHDGQMEIRAERRTETKGESGKPSEFRELECYQSIALPMGINKDKVEAKYLNGILTVSVPKTPEGKAKRIAVKGA